MIAIGFFVLLVIVIVIISAFPFLSILNFLWKSVKCLFGLGLIVAAIALIIWLISFPIAIPILLVLILLSVVKW